MSTKLKQEHDVHLLFANKKYKNKRKRFYILIVLFSKLNSAINIFKLVIFTYLNKSPHEIFHNKKSRRDIVGWMDGAPFQEVVTLALTKDKN